MDRYEPEIIRWDVDWIFIKDACMETISKRAGENEPDSTWKRKLLIAEHSPIRRSMISIRWDEIPSYVSTHFARHHEGVEKYIKTSREDRTGIPREERKQTDYVSMQMDMNIQALINIMRKRLCYQSDRETQKYALGLLKAIAKKDKDIAWACVPEGIRTCGCPELFGNCRVCNNFIINMPFEDRTNIIKRYDIYNNQRDKILKRDK